jgi:chemotaxis protein methyltransferase CheR
VANDVNPDYLRKAQAGIYPPSSLKEVPRRWQERYFKGTRRDRLYAVAEHLKEGITWQEGNLLSDPPGTGFQVIFLRNSLLTYYGEEVKVPAFEKVLNALARKGLLIIGAHERIPRGARGLLTPCSHPHIFQKGPS